MTFKERVCRSMPTSALHALLILPSWSAWWAAAWIELFQREVVDDVANETNNESGPWPVAMPRGMH